jgi:hypothetical protein
VTDDHDDDPFLKPNYRRPRLPRNPVRDAWAILVVFICLLILLFAGDQVGIWGIRYRPR